MPTQCFVCALFTPCYRFAGKTICGDCASDGAVLYSEQPERYSLEFVAPAGRRRLFDVEVGNQSRLLMGQVVRMHKLKMDAELEQIARGQARLVQQPTRHSSSDEMEEAA